MIFLGVLLTMQHREPSTDFELLFHFLTPNYAKLSKLLYLSVSQFSSRINGNHNTFTHRIVMGMK